MNKHYKTLELDKILSLLASFASLEDAKDEALALIPQTNMEEVTRLLGETDDAYRLWASHGAPSFGKATNVNNCLARSQSGGMLSMKEFLDVGEVLRVIRSLSEWRENCQGVKADYLDTYFSNLVPNKYFEEKIFFSIKSEDEMDDNASTELSNIRRKLRSQSLNVRDRLDKIIKGSAAKYLQDAIVTQRDGRFVVPVKVEYKSEIPGLVHDTSSSGATLFVEPMAVVEINNEIKVLRAKEKDEIERILFEMSAELSTFADTIKASYQALVSLCLIFAKAALAYDMNASLPNVNTNGKIYLKKARHPLLSKRSVVPITVMLGKEFDTLVITGPNTGGKTVTIKTIGLLTLMVMCGLMIPVNDGSEVSIFENILADIGDEQSIEQSLSTFSAHMTNIISIMKQADDKSLVLIDELGAGTDPVEGAALATAILMNLREKGAKIAATTHYAELKSFALENDGVCNASCEFDVNTLRPTYNLIIGRPGSSNAFAISEKLGLPTQTVELAKQLVSEEDRRFENTVAILEAAARKTEEEKVAALKIRAELENLKRQNKARTEELDKKAEKIIAKAREEAALIVERTRNESNRIISELEQVKKGEETSAADRLRKAKAMLNSSENSLEAMADPIKEGTAKDYKLPRALVVGDDVKLIDIGSKAKVMELSGTDALVSVGNIKMRVSLDNLMLIENGKAKEQPKHRTIKQRNSNTVASGSRDAKSEIDLRGMNTDEAIMELDRYIDNSLLAGFGTIYIIHGKGTGVLRKNIQEYLKTHRSIKEFRNGLYGEGELGVTVATLK